jgi:DNA-binding response OmpR family regulator
MNRKILVVEDELPIAKALDLKLTHSGFIVTVTHDGNEAIEILKKYRFDLVILDLMMPKMNGFEVLAEMKKIGCNVPTLVASNLSLSEDIQKVKELGAIDYFIKSNTSLSELVEKIEGIFKK